MRMFVFCADPREKANLDEKIAKKLLLPGEKPALISFFGGPICLAHPINLKEEILFLLKQIRFGLKTFPVTEIVLVGHDCGYYVNVSNQVVDSQTQRSDLLKAADYLRSYFPHMRISAHYDISTKEKVLFEKIASDAVLV